MKLQEICRRMRLINETLDAINSNHFHPANNCRHPGHRAAVEFVKQAENKLLELAVLHDEAVKLAQFQAESQEKQRFQRVQKSDLTVD